jgi:hypothetical protein
MISEKEVLDLFEKSQESRSQKVKDNFNIKIVEYFIQEFEKILENFKDKTHEKRITDLHNFYFNFEKGLTPEDSEPENYLEPEIMNLFLKVTEYLSKEKAEELLKEAKLLLENQ